MEYFQIRGFRHPFTEQAGRVRARKVGARFGRWLPQDSIAVLGLSAFVGSEPLSYIADDALEATLHILETDPATTVRVLQEIDLQFSHAVSSMLRGGSSWGREHRLEVRTPARLLEFEQIWHPEYQRYVEHVYNHLIRLPLGILGAWANKDYHKPTLGNRVGLLSHHKPLTAGFDAVVRNAISHGTTVFGPHAIRYIDSKVTKDLTPNAMGKLFDQLVETCHGIAAATMLWVARHWGEVERMGTQILPAGIRRLLVQGVAEYPGMCITSIIEADFPVQLSQANVHCTLNSRSRTTHLMESFYLAAAMVHFGKVDVQRIYIHIDCGAAVPALGSIKRDDLIRIMAGDLSTQRFREAAEGSFMWHDDSSLAKRAWMYRTSARVTWNRIKEEIVSDWRDLGLEVWSSRYKMKEIRYGNRRVDVELVLTTQEPVTKHVVRGVLWHAAKKLSRQRVPANEDTGLRVPRLPLYVCFRLHARNRSTRMLGAEGWDDPEMLAQGEWRANRKLELLWAKWPEDEYRGVMIRYNPGYVLPEGEPPKPKLARQP